MIPRKLTKADIDNICSHLLDLPTEDRRLRFGGTVSDSYIISYVVTSFESKSKWFGCYDGNMLVSACHVAISDEEAELGCSVDSMYRGEGLAQKMFDRAVTWLRTKGVTEVFMHCLTENATMKHIARKNSMVVVSSFGESDANVHIEPATPLTIVEDVYMDRMALYDMILKDNYRVFKNIVGLEQD